MTTLIKVICLSFAAVLFCSPISHACSCLYSGTFSQFSKGQIIIRGTVTNYGRKLRHGKVLYATMNVSVTEVINGHYAHSTVQFRGDPGHLCLTYVDANRYSLGSEHLFILFDSEAQQDLAGCGEVSVLVVDGEVRGAGYIDDDWVTYSASYNEFIDAIKE